MSVAAQFEAHASEDLSSPFYFNASHWRAMDGVVEGVKAREGIMVMSGPTGSGKTMLMRAISDNLGEGVTPLFLQYASLNFREFVNFLHNSLNVGDEVLDASNKAVALRKFLYAQAERHETAVVFVDEAQNLEPDVLRMLPKLACFDQLEDGTNVGLQFMLTGGSELREMMDDTDFEEVRDSVARSYDLRFFTREELKYFLEKRLAPLARLTPEPITDTAIDAVGRYTGGSPRLIGMICSHAMLFAAENPGRSIDEAMIEEAAEALMIEPVENAFADEDEEASDSAGPFSSADLRGDHTSVDHYAQQEAPEMDPTAMDSPIASSIDDTYDDASLADAGFTNFNDDFDEPEIDNSMDEIGMGLDTAQMSDEIDEDELDSEGVGSRLGAAAAPAAATVAAVGVASGSVLGRVKSAISAKRGKKAGELTHIVGAGRKGKNAQRVAEPTEKRAMKTRVAGRREKQVKYALCAAAFSGLVFGVYMIRADVSKVLASATQSVSNGASSAMERVASVGTDTSSSSDIDTGASIAIPDPMIAEPMVPKPVIAAPKVMEPKVVEPQIEIAALDIDTPMLDKTDVATAPKEPAPVKKGGWGAKVEVLQPVPKPNGPKFAAKLPDTGVGLARGALDLVDQVLEAGANAAPENVQGAFEAAAADVNSVRRTVTVNGATEDEQLARISELVAEGDSFFERKLLIAPARGNAYDSYRAALDIDPQNEAALQGIENLRAFYSKKAESARAKKQWDTANRFFETALGISQRKSVR